MPDMPFIDGDTRLYAIAGDPIRQTQTPQALNPRLAAGGANAVVVPLHVPAGRFAATARALMAMPNFHGLIVTYPFKAEALAVVDRVLPAAAHVGAINIMRRDGDGGWSGDILDGRGLVAGLAEGGVDLKGRRVLLIGTGGAGTAVAFAFAEAGAVALTLVDLDTARADRVAAGVAAAYPACRAARGAPDPAGHDLIVNATPMGMDPADPLPAAFARLDPATVVVDIVPKPPTPFVRQAQSFGCRTFDFRAMADGQRGEMMRFWGF